LLALPVLASNRTPPPVQPAASFAAVEAHQDEKVAIAAEPYDTRLKQAIFRVDYLSHGVLPFGSSSPTTATGPSACSKREFSFSPPLAIPFRPPSRPMSSG